MVNARGTVFLSWWGSRGTAEVAACDSMLVDGEEAVTGTKISPDIRHPFPRQIPLAENGEGVCGVLVCACLRHCTASNASSALSLRARALPAAESASEDLTVTDPVMMHPGVSGAPYVTRARNFQFSFRVQSYPCNMP